MLQNLTLDAKQRVLVTGGAGFIGSAFIRHLIKKTEVTVLNVDKLSYAADLNKLEEVATSPRYAFSQIDIADFAKLHNTVLNFKPTIVVHLAAESHVDRSILGPSDFIQSNIVGTFNLLESVREYLDTQDENIRTQFRFLHVSTDEVYGDLELDEEAFTEKSRYQPSSPYAASKASSDHLVRAWARTYNLPVLITNCSNNYGPYQFPEKLIPLVIHRALNGGCLPIYGDGMQIRDWLHVDDHVKALCTVIKKGRVGHTYNIGSNNEICNIELVRRICSLLEIHAFNNKNALRASGVGFDSLIEFIPDRPGHDKRYAINSDKIVNTLGWKPTISFESGLEMTVKWYIELFSNSGSTVSERAQ